MMFVESPPGYEKKVVDNLERILHEINYKSKNSFDSIAVKYDKTTKVFSIDANIAHEFFGSTMTENIKTKVHLSDFPVAISSLANKAKQIFEALIKLKSDNYHSAVSKASEAETNT